MPGSRVVAARARLAQRLKQQQAALATAVRCQDAVDAARVKADELAAQGARRVGETERALAKAIAHMVQVMGSVELVAAVLDVDGALVRKAVAAKRTGGRPDRGARRSPASARSVPDGRALAPGQPPV